MCEIGGIYALERVARDSDEDHPTVMEVLSAFVREHSRVSLRPARPGGSESERSPRPDVQAALTVIGRLTVFGRGNPKRHVRPIDLIGAKLAGAKLPHDADLTDAKLAGADLTGVDLHGVTLTGADLTDANLTGVDLTGADLTRANLTDASWSGDKPVPEGWKRDTSSGRLDRADPGSGPAEAK
jgi:uncharacterized protein YjbI with pentapeptide repeats